MNTYLNHYFLPKEYLFAFGIYFDVSYNKTADEYYKNVKLQDMNSYSGEPTNTLYIGDLVVANTDAKEDLDKKNSAYSPYGLMMSNNRNFGGKEYVKYDYVYTKLAKNLDKEVNRQE